MRRLFWVVTSVVAICGSGPPAAEAQRLGSRSFSLDEVDAPRLVLSKRQLSVRLRVGNTDDVEWPAGEKVVVVYRWLDRDGRRVDTDRTVAVPLPLRPGEESEVRAKLRTPEEAGFYRLRWGLAAKDVNWFSESEATRRNGRTVLVLPPRPFLVLVFPLLAAGFAVFLRWRWHRSGGRASGGAERAVGLVLTAELLWCLISLAGKPYYLYQELPAKLAGSSLLAQASIPALALSLIWLAPPRVRSILAWAAAAFGAFFVWAQTIHYRFFEDVASTASFAATGQAGDIRESIASLSASTDWWLAADLIVAIPLLVLAAPKGSRFLRVAGSIALLVLATPFAVRAARELGAGGGSELRTNHRTLDSVRRHGLLGYQIVDAIQYQRRRRAHLVVDPDERAQLLRWLLETAPRRAATGPWAGNAEGANLIAVQVESMQQFVVGMEVAGQEITPNLNRLARQGVAFPYIADQTSKGRSSAGDFVVNAGILPVADSVAYEFVDNDHQSLGRVLADRGYRTLSAIPYDGSFWNRQRTHPAYGWETNLYKADFVPGERIGWGTNDRDFFRQMLPRLIELDEGDGPFAAWLSTLSVHHPYRTFPEHLKALDLGEMDDTSLGNYLHGMNFFDRAFAELYAGLEESGLLERSVVALWGDHGSGLFRDVEYQSQFGLRDAPPKRYLHSRVPFLLWTPRPVEAGLVVETRGGQADITPTLLALLGIDPAALAYTGRNLLGGPEGPVVHPLGRWQTEELVYLGRWDEPESASCWHTEPLKRASRALCAPLQPQARRIFEASRTLLEFDLQTELSAELAQRMAASPEPAETNGPS